MAEPAGREFKGENRHHLKDIRVQSTDGNEQFFDVFIRQSLEFSENLSLGLMYLSPEGKRVTLVRFSGQHEQSSDPLDQQRTHFQYHTHIATEVNLVAVDPELTNIANPCLPGDFFNSMRVGTACSVFMDGQSAAGTMPETG